MADKDMGTCLTQLFTIECSTIKAAFMAGFMASGEGYNGEHAGANDPEHAAQDAYKEWIGERK